jgi:hypothetical protein
MVASGNYLEHGMLPATYKDVDAAINGLIAERPLLIQIKLRMERTGKSKEAPASYGNLCRVIEMLGDEQLLRLRLEELRGADGSIHFAMRPDALRLPQRWMNGRLEAVPL